MQLNREIQGLRIISLTVTFYFLNNHLRKCNQTMRKKIQAETEHVIQQYLPFFFDVNFEMGSQMVLVNVWIKALWMKWLIFQPWGFREFYTKVEWSLHSQGALSYDWEFPFARMKRFIKIELFKIHPHKFYRKWTCRIVLPNILNFPNSTCNF